MNLKFHTKVIAIVSFAIVSIFFGCEVQQNITESTNDQVLQGFEIDPSLRLDAAQLEKVEQVNRIAEKYGFGKGKLDQAMLDQIMATPIEEFETTFKRAFHNIRKARIREKHEEEMYHQLKSADESKYDSIRRAHSTRADEEIREYERLNP